MGQLLDPICLRYKSFAISFIEKHPIKNLLFLVSFLKIESVTTLNLPSKLKETMLKKAAMLSNLNMPQDEAVEFTDSNNNYNIMLEEAAKNPASSSTESEKRQEALEEMYRDYKFRELDPKLPIIERKEEIVRFIDAFDTCIIEGRSFIFSQCFLRSKSLN